MIHRKSRHEIAIMKKAGEIVARVHLAMKENIRPGISTLELDKIAEDVIVKSGATPTFKGYRGFPATICASINEQVVHGIPYETTVLKEGDIISIDVGATYKGLIGDSAWTYGVGEISQELKDLMEGTKKGLFAAIEAVKPGVNLLEISGIIEDTCSELGYGLVTDYGGHGTGRQLHEEPYIYNMRIPRQQVDLKSGMVICIEPMYNLGTGVVHTLPDAWTVVTNDLKPSAHFEHTIAVTEEGPMLLTVLD
ncbi:MAG: type I methionyl aminopeptidase [bacterium]